MSSIRSYRTEAIVLRRRANFGETDRILTLLSRDRGKIAAIAKGSRRIKSSLSGATEPCSYSIFQIAMGTNLDVVTQAELKDAFLGLRASLERISRVPYLLEFCDEFLEERQPHPDLFYLLLSGLYVLQRTASPDWVVTGFEVHALGLLGYAPQVRLCVSCGRPRGAGPHRYNAPLGGVVCADCASRHRDSVRVSGDAIAAIEGLERSDLPEIGSEAPSEVLAAEVRRVIRSHIRYRAEKEMRSIKFIEQLRAEDGAAGEG